MEDNPNKAALKYDPPEAGHRHHVEATPATSERFRTEKDFRPLIVIPAYKPSELLPSIVRTLIGSGVVQGVIVVNDGSGGESGPVFHELSAIQGVHLFSHPKNLGKGAALKTGFSFVASNFPESVGVVTADADGQHHPDDVLNVAEALVESPGELILGARSFDGEVPLRSRLGNILTRHLFRLFSGRRITDTQTGLRGVPMGLVPRLTRLRPNGYDFELETLLACGDMERGLREVGIKTIYLDGNRSSHFSPILDSMRVYFVFIRFVSVSLLSALVDNGVFLAVFAVTRNILASQVIGRVCSLLFNYFSNKHAVFHSHGRIATTIPKYLCLAVVLMLTSYFFIRISTSWWHWSVIVAKLTGETILFFLSFVAQRLIVFKNRDSTKPARPRGSS